MTKPLVSVLVPVHNGGDLIHESIASVVAQSFQDWIMFVVDNASVDGTREIVENWTLSDSRIQLLQFDEFMDGNENHERGSRIVANEAKYCKVLQADDLLFPDCLERMVSLAERFPSVGVVGAYRVSGDAIDMRELPIMQDVFDGREILRRTLLHRDKRDGISDDAADSIRPHRRERAVLGLLLRAHRQGSATVVLYAGRLWHGAQGVDVDAATVRDAGRLGYAHELSGAGRSSTAVAVWASCSSRLSQASSAGTS